MKTATSHQRRRLLSALVCLSLSAGLLYGMTQTPWPARIAATLSKVNPANRPAAKRKSTPGPVTALGASEMAEPAVPVQSGGAYNIVKSVVAGGGEQSANGSYNLNSTTGQSAANFSSGGQFSLRSGFWGSSAGCPAVEVNPVNPVLTAGTAGSPYTQTFTQTGGVGTITWSNPGGGLPGGLTLNVATGVLSGSPTASGAFSFIIRATDSNNCVGERQYSLQINNPACPTIVVNPANSVLTAGTVGTPYAQTFTQTGGAGTITWSNPGGGLPGGLTLNSATGILSGTSAVAGTFMFTIRATDSNNCAGQRQYTLTINCPTITLSPASLPNGTLNTVYSQTLSANSGTPSYSFSVVTGKLPTGLSLSTGGNLSGTPSALGTFTFTIGATDALGCTGLQTYSVQIANVNCIAVSISDALTAATGSSLTVPITAGNLTGRGVVAYDFTLSFNPAVLSLQSPSIEAAGTLSSGMTVTPSTAVAGQITVSAFGVAPLSGVGTLLNLKFNVIGASASSSSLTWVNFRFNENEPCATLSNGLVTVTGGSLSGTVSYCIAPSKKVPGVAVTSSAPSVTNTTNAAGFYTLAGLGGATTVTPAKTGDVNAISSFDASLVAQQVAGILTPALTACQQTAGDASNNGTLSSFDASLIAQFAAGIPNAASVAGTWKFVPSSRTYASVSGSLTGQDYDAVLIGDVSGNWIAPGNLLTGGPQFPLVQVAISLPTTSAAPGANLTIPITVGDLTGLGVTAFDFTLNFNQAVLQLQNPAFDAAGTLSNGLTITPNTNTPGQLRISAFGISPLAGAGTLLNLKFMAVGAAGTSSGLSFAPNTFLLNEDVQNNITNGVLTVVQSCPTITVNPANPSLPNGRAGTAYSQTFTQTGGAGAVTFSVSAGSLPTGLSLVGGVLSGTPTVNGNFGFTIHATDQNNCTGERAYTLLLHPPCTTLTVNPATLANGFQGTVYNQTLTATGGTAPHTFAVTAGSLPTGLNLASGGALTGTPTAAGTFTFTVTATDNTGCTGTRAYTVISSGNGLMFYPLPAPVRLLDTRFGASPNACSQPNQPIAGQTSRTQPGRNFCTIPANAQALTGNVTTVLSGGGFLTLYPSDAQQPTVASTNYGVNEVINNVFTVGLGADGAFKIFAHATTDVVVDVTGYYAPPGAGGLYFHPLPRPIRLLETRTGQLTGCLRTNAPLAGGTETTVKAGGLGCFPGTFDQTPPLGPPPPVIPIPASARAIVGNATTVGPQGNGFLTLFPGDATRPLVASSNYNLGQIVNGPFSVGLAPNGEFKIYTHFATDLVVDVLGYYSPEASDMNGAGLLFTPLPKPVRLLETRPGLPVGCFKPGTPLLGGSETLQTARGVCDGVTIPANALGVVGNATVVLPQGPGFLTLWPSTALRPTVATSNFNAGDVGNRHFIVGLGMVDGAFKIYTHATMDLVIDLSGYFAP